MWTVLIFDWRYIVCQCWMLKNNSNAPKICLFGQIAKQPLTNFEPWNSWKYKNLWRLGSDPYLLIKKLYSKMSDHTSALTDS